MEFLRNIETMTANELLYCKQLVIEMRDIKALKRIVKRLNEIEMYDL